MNSKGISNYQIKVQGKTYSVPFFNKKNANRINKSVNIFASGPSIDQLSFTDDLLENPSIFVNGSLSLIDKHDFANITAYVISDERFIKHNAEILEQLYTGQPLYITKPVIDAIATALPNLIQKYQDTITLIYPVDRPLTDDKLSLLKSLPILNKVAKKKLSLDKFEDHQDFVIDSTSYPKPIGVSLNIENGFVEAGTVAFVAAQLAYTLGAEKINLYGIDLINSSQPRFYESKDDAAPCKLDKAITDRIVPSFDLMGKVYNQHGTKVINKSPVSKSLFRHI